MWRAEPSQQSEPSHSRLSRTDAETPPVLPATPPAEDAADRGDAARLMAEEAGGSLSPQWREGLVWRVQAADAGAEVARWRGEEAATQAEATRRVDHAVAAWEDALRKLEEESARRGEAERRADREAGKRAEAERRLDDEAVRRKEAGRRAAEEATKRDEAERRAEEEAARREEAERQLDEEVARREEAERSAARPKHACMATKGVQTYIERHQLLTNVEKGVQAQVERLRMSPPFPAAQRSLEVEAAKCEEAERRADQAAAALGGAEHDMQKLAAALDDALANNREAAASWAEAERRATDEARMREEAEGRAREEEARRVAIESQLAGMLERAGKRKAASTQTSCESSRTVGEAQRVDRGPQMYPQRARMSPPFPEAPRQLENAPVRREEAGRGADEEAARREDTERRPDEVAVRPCALPSEETQVGRCAEPVAPTRNPTRFHDLHGLVAIEYHDIDGNAVRVECVDGAMGWATNSIAVCTLNRGDVVLWQEYGEWDYLDFPGKSPHAAQRYNQTAPADRRAEWMYLAERTGVLPSGSSQYPEAVDARYPEGTGVPGARVQVI